MAATDPTMSAQSRHRQPAGNLSWPAGEGFLEFHIHGTNPDAAHTDIIYPVSPALAYRYDAAGRLTNMVDGLGVTGFSRTEAGQLAMKDGPWPDDAVSMTYTNRMRAGLALAQPSASAWVQGYAYDEARRLTGITAPAGTYAYTLPALYSSATARPGMLTFPGGAKITYGYDGIGRLTSTELKNSGGVVLNRHEYGYDAAHQRTSEVRSDDTAMYYNRPRVDHTYDRAGQLRSSLAADDNGSMLVARPQERFGYAYDAAGNLSARTNNPGADPLLQTFVTDGVNQLVTAGRSESTTVSGQASAGTVSVTVNGSAATLFADGSFAKTGLTLVNGVNTFTAIATDALGLTDTNVVVVNLPASVGYAYDLDGNLTSDGRRAFAYDDEDQLTSVTIANVSKSEFIYDGLRRRRITREYGWTGSAWSLSKEVRHVYDGMVVLQERDNGNLPKVTYTRGMDLSRTRQGAGGIGGLLARTDMVSASTAYYHSDAGGNITAMVDASGNVAASYRYDPFGNLTALSGPPFSNFHLHQWTLR